tara:strand:+ start:126 stop:629 length:504 start_codon:yes stop_codon:yes gene_type:complete
MINVEKNKKISNLSFSVKKFLRFYNWQDCSPSKSIRFDKQLSESKVVIISSAGLVVKNTHKPFDTSLKMGDSSFRMIPSNINPKELEEYHKSNTFDHSGVRSNPFSVMPINHLKSLKENGLIRSISSKHISVMGSIINTSKLVKNTIPEIVSFLKKEKVDIALLIPV